METTPPFTVTHHARPYPVFARKIMHVNGTGAGGVVQLTLEDGTPYTADTAMTARHYPVSGDYLIIGEDGYPYLNTPELLERKYERVDEFGQPAEVLPPPSRFNHDDQVMFQPRIGLVSTEREYDNAVPARVIRARLINDILHYDIKLLDELHPDGDVWVPLCGVDSMMVLPDAPATASPGGPLDDDAVLRAHLLQLATPGNASAFFDVHDIISAAQEMEKFVRTGMPPAQPASKPAPAAPAKLPSTTVLSLDAAEEPVDEVYFNARQAMLALGRDDNPELERLTFCVLVLRSGALIVGVAMVVSLENFDEAAARQQAYRDALAKLNERVGFLTKTRLHEEDQRNAAGLPA